MTSTKLNPADCTLTWDAVIATRNRPEALELSIPLLRQQTRPPEKLIVIDSSDNHDPVAEVVAQTTQGWDIEVVVRHTAKGLTRQRNIGLEFVTAPIVVFPDDDSLFYLDAIERMMSVYELDTDGVVAGVCANPVDTPPPESPLEGTYEISDHHKREEATQALRNRVERNLTHLKPSLYIGQLLRDRQAIPAWFDPEQHAAVEYMTGFRMSFRTEILRKRPFDENLVGYALDEDVEASLSAAYDGLLIGALGAKVYHHRNPSGREKSYIMGAIAVLNRAYVVAKHVANAGLSEAEARSARSRMNWFVRAKLLTDLRFARHDWGRDRLRGARKAARYVKPILQAPRDEIEVRYTRAKADLGL